MTRAALVIAAHDFEDPKFQQLRSPVQDVDALAGVLGDPAIGGFEVKTVVNQRNSLVAQELERFFSNRRPDDLLLLYFSCHGVKDPAGRLYFATSNTMFELLRSSGISASFVSEQMEYSRSKRIIVLLDCCYSGAFLKGFRARGGDAVGVDQLEGRGRAVITASRATEYAFEADALSSEDAQPSMFTGAIVDGLTTGAADVNGDGLVTVDELYDYVYDAVRGKVAGQTPGRWIDVEGDLVVAHNPRPPMRAAVLPPELVRALESDAALQRLGAVWELERWFRSDDLAKQLAAAPVLEQLSRDYDERVKAAAQSVLDGAGSAPSAVPPSPAAPTPPPPVVPPAAEVTAPPEQAPPVDRDGVARAAGWLTGAGGLAILLSPYFAYIRHGDYSDVLADRNFFALGAFVVFALGAYAAYCLLRVGTLRDRGLAILASIVPFAAGETFVAIGDASQKDILGPGLGWFVIQAGFALLMVAGVLAVLRLRRIASLSLRLGNPADIGATATTAAAIVVGAATVLGWAKLFGISGDGILGLALSVQSLVIRLVLLAAVACVAWRWAKVGPSSRRAFVWGFAALLAAIVALFLANGHLADPEDWAFRLAFALLAIGSVIVPILAANLVPERLAFPVLAAWAVACAAWVPSELARGQDAELLAVALAGAAALAAVLALSGRRVQ